ncbi:DNA-directed RNA polymerase subunit beta [Candidatus Nomurabacteria bacterium]|nr:DNA-directed RNA polymerase subunit beta [Candidatus Nomurabacteria bacterium]MCB9803887.1 DNA-directed RNA polymerase subunit beta [Candidatus Nomurabacteria bacterium]
MAVRTPYTNRSGRVNLGVVDLQQIQFPDLIEAQLRSFEEFLQTGFQTLFNEINPVKDSMERMWTLYFKDFRYDKPNRSMEEATEKGLSYDAPLYATAQLMNNRTGEIKEQEIFIADVPLMSDQGFFIINGVRRVVTHQIVRAEGVLFEVTDKLPTRNLYSAKLMPERGQWYEFEVNKHNVISIRLAQKRPKILVTELLRVFGYETDEQIHELFKDVDTNEDHRFIESTLARDFTRTKEEAIINVYNKVRPDESVTLDSAEKYIKGHFFNNKRFDLGKVGRYQLNRKLGTTYDVEGDECKLYVDDIILIIKRLINIHNGVVQPDDIDSLSNRRLRSVGEVLVDQLRVGVRRVEKNIRDKMSMYGEDAKLTPSMLISAKPVSAAILTFFGSNQLSMFMDQANILSELENKRKITAAGPGGLTKERASFSVREVHHTHYSRVDPVTSPESASIGVVNQLAVFARVNKYGFLEAPYYPVINTVKGVAKELENRIPLEDIKSGNKIIARAGEVMTSEVAKKVATLKLDEVQIVPYIGTEVVYLDASTETEQNITMYGVEQDEYANITAPVVPVRHEGDFLIQDVRLVSYIDIVPSQQAGVGMALIPFVNHDDSKRALTGSNQQRQAVPLIKQQAPLVGTGYEEIVAKQSGWGIYAEDDGEVILVDAATLIVNYKEKGRKEYKLTKFFRSNYDTSFSQKPIVDLGQKFKKGEILVDGPTMKDGELALGTNIRAALMFYEGFNYEDSVIISERLVRNDALTSIHIKEYAIDLRDTELGPEVLTADIPHVSERILQNLDFDGVVRVGARVTGGDILGGVVAPRGEQELTAEERLLRAIFGKSASEVRDVSLRVPHGSKGIVVNTQVLSVDNDDKLKPGVLKQVKVWVAETKKLDYGDKISGRHGDKNTVAAIRPVEDMPFTADGEPVDIVLTPTFVKRMNMGQALEVHWGRYASLLGKNLAFPLFEDINEEWVREQLKKEGYDMDQKVDLYDGRSGNKFPRKVTVGVKYVLKLKHIADEKVHARSTGPYTLVTQQPLGGKAQMGGQRFGEMEVWALEAHGTPYALQEMLTIKSDDVKGRAAAYKAIIHGEKIEAVNIPESFKVLVKELNALCINMDLISTKTEEVEYESE